MNDLVQTNLPGFSKHKATGLIVNTDDGAYQRILAQRDQAKVLINIQRDLDKIKGQIVAINKALGLE